MGEMADFTIDNGFLSDLMDDGEQAATTCRYCSKDGLYWYQEEGRWRLIEYADSPNWKFHECDQHPSRRKKANKQCHMSS